MNEYKMRRQKVLAQIEEGSVAVLFSAREYARNGNNLFPYRQDSDFYYLSGFDEPESVLVLVPGRAEGETIMFNRAHDPHMEVWFGKILGQKGACAKLGVDQAFAIEELDALMSQLLEDKQKVFFKIGRDSGRDAQIMQWVNKLKDRIREGVHAPTEFVDLEKILHPMRLRKSATEITAMRKAAEITTGAYLCAMQNCKPGMIECELEAVLLEQFIKSGGRYPAFESIVGGGKNACTLHYSKNNEVLEDGELVLLDAGVEYEYYSADITRTFPINGRFTLEQRQIYQAVLDAQLAVINIVKPGVPWCLLQNTAEQVITQKLLDLGLLQGSLAESLEKKAFKAFFMHRIGHWLGIDCHDVGEYRSGNDWQLLESGMVFTVEPGIYIVGGNSAVDRKWWNIGVRIEDDILVTEDGCEVLTRGIPKTVNDVEAAMKR